MNGTARALHARLAGTPTIGIIGLGYVGLPLAVAFAESGATVIGTDLDPTRVIAIRNGRSFIEDVPATNLLQPGNRRLTLAGQRIDTGPEFLTFLGIWEEYLRRWDGPEDQGRGEQIADLDLVRLPKIGTYHYRGNVCSLPVEEDHPWHAP